MAVALKLGNDSMGSNRPVAPVSREVVNGETITVAESRDGC